MSTLKAYNANGAPKANIPQTSVVELRGKSVGHGDQLFQITGTSGCIIFTSRPRPNAVDFGDNYRLCKGVLMCTKCRVQVVGQVKKGSSIEGDSRFGVSTQAIGCGSGWRS